MRDPEFLYINRLATPVGEEGEEGPVSTRRGLSLRRHAPGWPSVLLRAFQLNKDENCSVVVRPGDNQRRAVVNYHPRTIARFRELTATPPAGLDASQKAALKRVRARLGAVG